MERKWYNENFDKDTLKTKGSISEMELEEIKHQHAELKSKLLVNVVEFLVGVILLIFCFTYLQSHPAEKTSLFSGVEVIVHNIEVFFSDLVGWRGEEIEEKYKLEQTFEEMIALARSGECLTTTELEQIERASGSIQSMTLDEFLKKERSVRTTASLFYTKIKNGCAE